MEDEIMTRAAKKELKNIIHEMSAKGYRRGYDWKGYEVYEPVYAKPMYIGGPLVIFVKGNKVWLAPHDEGEEYIHYSILKADEEERRAAGQT
ncbi:MAG: hypothetical protein LUD51_05180 [Clostridia bacterium]|nr:hypothetical protein [Clostridia bacterium]